VAKVYIVSFRTHDHRRPSKFIVLADSMKSAIKMAWEHGGADFQSRYDKSHRAGLLTLGGNLLTLDIDYRTRSAPSFICSACAVDLSNQKIRLTVS
jgi:hypothetical protein